LLVTGADLDRAGRLSLREFVYALWLAELAKASKELPKSADHRVQEEMTRAVERMLAKGKDLPATAGLLPEAFSAGPVAPADADEVLARLKQAVTMMVDTARCTDADLDGLADALIQARRELNQGMAERNQAECDLHEDRALLDNLYDRRRQAEKDTSIATRRLTHLTDELSYLGVEVGSAQDDLQMLADLTAGREPFSPGGQEFSAMEFDATSIGDIKGTLARISAEKQAHQARMQHEIEKQRQTEHDRSLMVLAIEAERSKLSQLSAERMKLCEERLVLEKEMAQIAQGHWEVQHAAADRMGQSPPRAAAQQFSSNPPLRGIRTEGTPPVVYASTDARSRAQVVLTSTDPRANTSIFGVAVGRSPAEGI